MLLYQMLAYTIHGNIKKWYKTINYKISIKYKKTLKTTKTIKYQLQHGMINLNYLMGLFFVRYSRLF